MFIGCCLSLYPTMRTVNECAFHTMSLNFDGAEYMANRYATKKVKANWESADAVSASSEPECSRPTATRKTYSSHGFRSAWLSRGSARRYKVQVGAVKKMLFKFPPVHAQFNRCRRHVHVKIDSGALVWKQCSDLSMYSHCQPCWP